MAFGPVITGPIGGPFRAYNCVLATGICFGHRTRLQDAGREKFPLAQKSAGRWWVSFKSIAAGALPDLGQGIEKGDRPLGGPRNQAELNFGSSEDLPLGGPQAEICNQYGLLTSSVAQHRAFNQAGPPYGRLPGSIGVQF